MEESKIIEESKINDLKRAIIAGDNEKAKAIISQDVDIIFRKTQESHAAPIDVIAQSGNAALFSHAFSNSQNPEKILTYCDDIGFSIPTIAISFGQENFINHLLTTLTQDQAKLMFENPLSSITTPLRASILKNKRSIAEALIKHKIDLTFTDSYGFSPLQLAILDGGYDRLLIENGIVTADKIANIRKTLTACAFLEFAYSEGGFYTRQDWAVKMYSDLGAVEAEESDRKFLDALRIIQSGELVDIGGGKKIKALEIDYLRHVAYMITICNSEGVPQEIAYCDSYIPFADSAAKYKDGEYRFVPKSKFKNVADLEKEISETLNSQSSKTYLDPKNLAEKFSKFVCCDEKGNPVILEKKIPMQKQSNTRTNCAFKSVNMAMRTIASIMHPEMTYELAAETGKPSGTLHRDYKYLRAKTIDEATEILYNFVMQDKNVGNNEYALAVRYCELAFVKATKKQDIVQKAKLSEMLQAVYARRPQVSPSSEIQPAHAMPAGARVAFTLDL